MIRKTVQKHRLDKDSEIRQNLQYWLSRTPEERLEAVEILRRRVYGGNLPRIQKVVKVLKLKDLADIGDAGKSNFSRNKLRFE